MEEMQAAGWPPDIAVELVRGPGEYLFGEEQAKTRCRRCCRNIRLDVETRCAILSIVWEGGE